MIAARTPTQSNRLRARVSEPACGAHQHHCADRRHQVFHAALLGLHLVNFGIGLVLLGVGWNFGFVGATAMLTGYYRPAEKNVVQGINDFCVFTTVAIASLLRL